MITIGNCGSGNCGKETRGVIVWTDHGLEAGTRLRELMRFVRWLLRGE